MRADAALVARGLVESRSRAAAEISAGHVFADGAPVARASQTIAEGMRLELRGANPWVGRGGLKLAAALDAFAIDPKGKHVLDLGASTGGFTEVCLARGAAHVTAVDVGRGQLHPRLAADPRVTLHEKTDARALTSAHVPRPPALIVADLSFISLTQALVPALALAAPDAALVALVKPQFEAGRAAVGKGGVVKDGAARRAAVDKVAQWLSAQGWTVRGAIESPVAGGDGNVEFLLAAAR